MDFNQWLEVQFQSIDFRRDYFRMWTVACIGNELILIRKELGLTQEELAAKIDMPIDIIDGIESGNFDMPISNIINVFLKLNKKIRFSVSDL